MLNNTLNKRLSIAIPFSFLINYYYYQKFKILIIKVNSLTFYLIIPICVKIFYANHVLIFFSLYSYFTYFKMLKILFKNLKKKFYKTIFLKGTGFKFSFLENSFSILKLKLGFSHFILIKIPCGISVFIFKKKIIIAGLNLVAIGNFCSFLINQKARNIFTGKGLWLKTFIKFKLKNYTKEL